MNQDCHPCIENHPITLYQDGKLCETSQAIIREVMLEIIVNGTRIVSIACLGEHLQDLTLGFLLAEGYIDQLADIKSIKQHSHNPIVEIETLGQMSDYKPVGRSCVLTSGARTDRIYGKDYIMPYVKKKNLRIRPEQVLALADHFLEQCRRHALTGATHAAALADAERIGIVREDIGRHNCMDMLSGHLLQHGDPDSWPIVLRTGRVSEEIVLKAARWPIVMIVSLSVPTARAIFLADRCGMTLIGSVRNRFYKIYSHPHRVTEKT